MARILYGIAGEGMGHAVRSRVVIEHLSKENEIKIATSGKAYSYLTRFFNVEEIDYFRLIYKNNKTSIALTLLNNIVRLPKIFLKSLKIYKIIKESKPDMIITDFEPLVDYFAFFCNIPVISIDNQHIITKTSDKMPKKYRFEAFLTLAVMKLFIIKSNKYFINSFFNCSLKDKNSVLIKPLLRKEIINAKTAVKEHILVYQTFESNKKLIKILQTISEKFVVYGFHKNKKLGNVFLKEVDESNFLEDLKSCKAVITSGGFVLISEALYLKKPVLSMPIKGQFEQILNAIYLERLGYGIFAEESSKEIIENFIKKIPKFKKNLSNYKKYANKEALDEIAKAIKNEFSTAHRAVENS
ncbi:hypothetical protein HYX01_02645 [Candidatus Woesearchaeota archaeon]|nr:hypothetical protein [Candidatus Woesearchaeota archaeon]